jgi:putative phosphoesterase
MRARARRVPKVVERHVDLEVSRGGDLRLVVVADTHSHPHPESARTIAAERPDAILHGGDIGDLAVLDGLGAIAPVHAVRGNIDIHAPSLPDVMTIAVRSDGATLLTLLLLHIAVAGPRIRADAAKRARAAGASLIVCGHSHVPFIGRDRGLLVFNPGSIGPRRFQLPIVFGVVSIEGGKLGLRHVDCATGATWMP